ncbi:uncharacterized protein LOC106139710 [Amyelois transitella]|uniref:uncharacterized protein LOC106139710 n=1 Tax=Amyelois transitella TaxID=680683 RepID=UPI00298F6858|nr:uncharacterized protein LOC106139710 [Amyelois transitella]
MGSSRSENIQPITHSSGLYFDPTSTVYFYDDFWNVVTHVEILPIEPYLLKIKDSITHVSNYCEKAQNIGLDINCQDVINPLQILVNSNQLKLDSLSHLVSETDSKNRHKRAIEFIGEIMKFFFGTLDADDARKYDEAINSCQQNEHEVFSLMKDNIHVVQSTIKNFNISIKQLNDNEFRINKQLSKLEYIMQQNTKLTTNSINLSKINSLLNIIEGSLISVSDILDTTLNSILFAKANILHPYVLTPTNLYNELNSNKVIKRNLEFPVSLSLENIHYIIDLSKLASYYYNNKIIFVIRIPLINSIKFNLYKILPLPTPRDNYNFKTYVLIHPSKLYLALTDDRLNYAMFDNLSECKDVNYNYMICPLPSILSTINNPTCETKLITEVTLSLPEICDFKVIYGNLNIWQKLNDGKYLYVQSKANKLTVKCTHEIKDYTLQGTGMLSLKNDCIAYFQTLQFRSSHVYKTELPSQLLIDFNIIEDDCCSYNLINNTMQPLSPLSLTNIDLESLNIAAHKLNNIEAQIRQAEGQSHIVKYGHYYSALTYFCVTLIILYILYKIYKKWLNSYCNNSACCIQIYNQCYNKKLKRHDTKVSSSIELTDISDSSSKSTEYDNKSIKSLPEIEIHKHKRKVAFRTSANFPSNRNLTNF